MASRSIHESHGQSASPIVQADLSRLTIHVTLSPEAGPILSDLITPMPSVVNRRANRRAFTLIELLVVIGIITLLASLLFPTIKAINRQKIINRANAERDQIALAIGVYKDKRGYYPPDNPANPAISPLYFELVGTTLTNGVYLTLDGSAQISQGAVSSAPPTGFGPGVTGFMNSTAGPSGDDKPGAQNFFVGLRTAQVGEMAPGIKLLVGAVPWPANVTPPPTPNPTLDPWCYNSSNPSHNPKSYDLWIDIVISGKTHRVCNWSEQPIILP